MSSQNVAGLAVTTQAKYNVTPPTYADGAATELQADENGNLMVTGEDKTPLAKESTLQLILAAVDGLEGFTDGLETLLTTMNGYVDGLEGYTDGIEGLIGTANSLLTTLNGYVDGLEGMLDGVEGSLTSIDTKVATETTLASILAAVDQLEGYLDGVETLITSTNTKLDTVSGQLPATLGQKAMAASLSVVVASDQSTVPVGGNVASGATDSGNPVKAGGKYNSTLPTLTDGQRGDVQLDSRGRLRTQPEQPTPNSGGSYTQGDIAGATTLTAPANAIGFILEASSDNTDNMRWRENGSAASSSSGHLLEPGRDTGFIPMAKSLSICPVSGTQQYQITWVLSA